MALAHLVTGLFRATCGNCHNAVSHAEIIHRHCNGCGARFVSVWSTYRSTVGNKNKEFYGIPIDTRCFEPENVMKSPLPPLTGASDMKLVFIDTETTGLNRKTRRIWDLAYIVREPGMPDVEHQLFVNSFDLDLHKADPKALSIGGFWERHPKPEGGWSPLDDERIIGEWELAQRLFIEWKDAYLVGAVPSFDEETIARLMHREGFRETWNHHLIDVETLAAGQLKLAPPWSFDTILDAYGLKFDEKDRHTAIGDARMARDLYDAVMAGR